MNITLGFVFILIFILIPGLIFRRLYFYGEFSKQFNSKHNLISLIAISSLPGLAIFLFLFLLYDYFITDIYLDNVIDYFKDIVNPSFRYYKKYNDENIKNIKNVFIEDLFPFIVFLYLTAFLFGIISGRFVRFSRLDKRFKLLRFKNYWFYLFSGDVTGFKKLKSFKQKNKKHTFTKADILIDTNNGSLLYSGIVVDYELKRDDSTVLSKVVLEKAQKILFENENKTVKDIEGTIFIVDCSNLVNINLRYVYEQNISVLKTKIPKTIELAFGILVIILIPFFIFKFDSINFSFYNNYFNLRWYSKIFAFIAFIQFIGLFNPFVRDENNEDEFRFISLKYFIGKLFLLLFFIFLIYITY